VPGVCRREHLKGLDKEKRFESITTGGVRGALTCLAVENREERKKKNRGGEEGALGL